MKKLVLVLLLIAMVVSGKRLIETFEGYRVANTYYESMQIEYVEISEETQTPLAASPTLSSYIDVALPTKTPMTTKSEPSKEKSVPLVEIRAHTTTEHPPITIDFAALKRTNSDVVGWIYCANTPINYPILHSNSNNKYIHTLLNGEYSANGSIFLDSACAATFTDDNSILYGHHMRNGSMFAALNNYKEQEYYDTHNKMWLLTPTCDYLLLPFSAMVATTDNVCYSPSIADMRAFIDYAIINSFFAPETAPTVADRILTLSTCDYTFDNARLVVLCILVPIN